MQFITLSGGEAAQNFIIKLTNHSYSQRSRHFLPLKKKYGNVESVPRNVVVRILVAGGRKLITQISDDCLFSLQLRDHIVPL